LHVVGRAADDIGIQCGGWTISWQGQAGPVTHGGTTILTAVRHTVGPDTEVTYSATGEVPHGVDAVLVVVGEMPYAEGQGDSQDLRLSAENQSLITKARESGAPVITVLIFWTPFGS